MRWNELNRTLMMAASLCYAEGALAQTIGLRLPPDVDLSVIAQPNGTPHEGIPNGVPNSYDWQAKSKQLASDAMPQPGYNALTGWGQAFWLDGTGNLNQALELKDSQTYLCIGSTASGQFTWKKVQSGGIEGGAFQPSFVDNENITPTITPIDGGIRVVFPASRAFHFWPLGRAAFNRDAGVCGVLYLFQARAVRQNGAEMGAGSERPALIVGGGADYWTNVSAPWVGTNPPNNQGIGVGQLRTLSARWHWFGFSTASWAALHALDVNGYSTAP